MQSSLVVVGSTNTDMVIKCDRLPAPGETILGGDFFMNQGGKGANQAVAAVRLGIPVTLVAKLGDDIFGKQSLELFRKDGIDTRFVFTDPNHPSGIALITIDARGENCIAVASGANAALMPTDVEAALGSIRAASMVLMQLETPVDTVAFVAAQARDAGVPVILNPAPATTIPSSLLQNVSVLTPNETEAQLISGVVIHDFTSAERAAAVIREKGVETVIITMGAQGALIATGGSTIMVPAPTVEARDTTAAGDVFNGALAVALCEGQSLEDAARFACHAAALSVTRLGAQASAPWRSEVEDFIQTK